MMDTLMTAHKRSSLHRDEILASAQCGCFFCMRVYPPEAIGDWTDFPSDTPDDEVNTLGQTALCPACGIDSVIGDGSGFPAADTAFLRKMRERWFWPVEE